MDFVSDEIAETLVNELMPGQWPFAFELSSNHERLEVGIVVAKDFDNRSRDTGLD